MSTMSTAKETMRDIEITSDDKPPMNFTIKNGIIKMSVVRRVHPSASGFSYMKGTKMFFLNPLDNSEDFQAIEGVHEYKVYCIKETIAAPSSLSQKQKSDFVAVLNTLKKNVSGEMKSEMKKEVVSATPKIGNKKRKLKINWQHRDGVEEKFYKMPGSKEVTLESNEVYTVEYIKDLAIKLYKNDLNANYFESTNVEVADKDNYVITKFINKDGEKGLWKYIQKTVDKAHRATIHLLTTYVGCKKVSNVSQNRLRSIENQISPRQKSDKSKNDAIEFSWDSKDYPNCSSLLKSQEVNASASQQFSREIAKNRLQKNNVSPTFFKVPAVQSIENSFARPTEPSQKKRKVLDLDDLNSLKVPLVTTIPFNDLIISDEILGKGSFGTVRKGYWSECEVAIKTIDTNYGEPREIIKEVAVLRQISHKNIVRIMGVCHHKMEFHIVMDLISGYSLKDVIFSDKVKQKLPVSLEDKHSIALQICKAIAFLHNHPLKIIHRDIKPANILLNFNKKVKVCDLGLAKVYELNSQLLTTKGKATAPGTSLFMAPEIYLDYKETTQYSDVWAMGCTFVELFSETQIWILNKSGPRFSIEALLLRKEIPSLENVPLHLREILKDCFHYEDVKRPTAKQMVQKFQALN